VVVTGFFDIDPSEIASRIPPEDKMLYIQKPFHLRELRQFAAAFGAKWQSERLLRKANAELEKKVNQLKVNEKELVESKVKLENLNTRLMETNDALSVLARNLDSIRRESERRVLQSTRTLILPVLEKLVQDKGLEKYGPDLTLLMRNVENLSLDFSSGMSSAQPLSASEMRIAAMIRNGMTSEEIAKHLSISLSTVKTHRKNIRRKLNLRNSGTNLRVFIESQMGKE
jgi:DNA-binding CsgD family transcriptional regulator